MLKGNKGEWSELYVLVKLLSEGKLFQSDVNLEKDLNNVYDVIKVYKEELGYEIEFVRDNDVEIYKTDSSHERIFINRKTIDEFTSLSKLLLVGIKEGVGRTFELPEVETRLLDTAICKVKTKSTSKADIKIRIYDHRLSKETDLGFSIKSLLGGDSTLFNTGVGNNFIFQVTNFYCEDITDFNRKTLSSTTRRSKITDRLDLIDQLGGKLTFKDVQSENLWRNLKMVDGDLPEILGWSLYYRYMFKSSRLVDVCELLENNDPLNFYKGKPSTQKFYYYKIQKFLVESAMGMTSEKLWDGEYDSFGGVIIPKSDGDVVCFHIYDFNLFREYLINNTRFEQPSTGEDINNPGSPKDTGKKYNYGWLYEQDGSLFIKINLQVRFV